MAIAISSTRSRASRAALRMMSARLAGEVCRQTRNPSCAGQSGIEIVAGRVRYGAEDALVGGIEHRLAIRAFPFTRDEKLHPDMSALSGSHSRAMVSALSRKIH
jgi:hypothetical protein